MDIILKIALKKLNVIVAKCLVISLINVPLNNNSLIKQINPIILVWIQCNAGNVEAVNIKHINAKIKPFALNVETIIKDIAIILIEMKLLMNGKTVKIGSNQKYNIDIYWRIIMQFNTI